MAELRRRFANEIRRTDMTRQDDQRQGTDGQVRHD
jgi:hypothetical protein